MAAFGELAAQALAQREAGARAEEELATAVGREDPREVVAQGVAAEAMRVARLAAPVEA